MADDELGAVLAEIREAVADVPAQFGVPLDGARASLAAGILYGTAGKLLKAVEAALEYHQPVQLYGMPENYRGETVCGHDQDYDGDQHFEGDDGLWYCRSVPTVMVCGTCCDGSASDLMAPWPCPEYGEILAALTGEEAGGAEPE